MSGVDEFQELQEFYDEHFGLVGSHTVPTQTNDEYDDEEEEEELGASSMETDVVEEFMATRSSVLDGGSGDDLAERVTARDRCNCQKGCLSKFSPTVVEEHVFALKELEKGEKEFYIMGILHNLGSMQCGGHMEKRIRIDYSFRCVSVCQDAFCLLFDIGDFTLRALNRHIREHGLCQRVHGNKGRKPHHALNYADVLRVVTFIRKIAEDIGLPMPAPLRGTDGDPPVYLPVSTTKTALHAEYVACCADEDARTVKFSTFTLIWRTCLGHIKIASPREDVCSTCKDKRKSIMDARTECEKVTACGSYSQHVQTAQKEHATYRRWVEETKSEGSAKAHYTFDFAQMVTVPHHGRQMGPLYFLTPRRIHVFGFRIDSASTQINYLADEGQTTGLDGKGIHGPDAVISMLDHGLQEYHQGEQQCGLHADNCFGQNKNWYVLAYLAWRIMEGLHTHITYMMQIPGHTKCLVDSGFGKAKRLYRRTDADTIYQVAEIFAKSAASNHAVLYQDEGCSGVNWEWRDWKAYLSRFFKPLKGISKFHIFEFSQDFFFKLSQIKL